MKRIYVIIVAILMAQMSFAQHYIGVGASLSSPFILDKSEATRPLVGIGEGVTLSYQYRHGHFLLSIGAAMSSEHPRVGVADEKYESPMIDANNRNFIYKGSLESRSDMSSSLWFHTPVMIGFEIYPFYMMVGAQYSLFLRSWTHQKALLEAAAKYDRYYDDHINDMPTNFYYNNKPVSTKGQITYKNDVRLLVELGGTLQIGKGDNGLDRLLRIGAYAEIGMMDVLGNPTEQNNKTEWDVSKGMNVTMNHVYSAEDGGAGSLRNIVVGVKATCLFPVGEEQTKKKHYKTNRNCKKYKCRCVGNPYSPFY